MLYSLMSAGGNDTVS